MQHVGNRYTSPERPRGSRKSALPGVFRAHEVLPFFAKTSWSGEYLPLYVGELRGIGWITADLPNNQPPFLGYTLYLSGLVFLNELRIENNIDRRDAYIGHLKTIFTVLGAMRSFFSPSSLWVDSLFRIHSLGSLPETVFTTSDLSSHFCKFFNRFPGHSEAPYCTLNPSEIAANAPMTAQHSYPAPTSQSSKRVHVRLQKQFAGTGVQDGHEKGKDGQGGGLGDYSRALGGFIKSLGRDEEVLEDPSSLSTGFHSSLWRERAAVSQRQSRSISPTPCPPLRITTPAAPEALEGADETTSNPTAPADVQQTSPDAQVINQLSGTVGISSGATVEEYPKLSTDPWHADSVISTNIGIPANMFTPLPDVSAVPEVTALTKALGMNEDADADATSASLHSSPFSALFDDFMRQNHGMASPGSGSAAFNMHMDMDLGLSWDPLGS